MSAWFPKTRFRTLLKGRARDSQSLGAAPSGRRWTRWGIRVVVLAILAVALWEAGAQLRARSRRMVVEYAVDAARGDLVGRAFEMDSGSFTLTSLESMGWQGREVHLLARGSGTRRVLLIDQPFRFTVRVVLVPNVSVGLLETTAEVTGTCRRVRIERKRLAPFLANLTTADEFIDRLVGDIARSELSTLLERGYFIRYRYGGELSVAPRSQADTGRARDGDGR